MPAQPRDARRDLGRHAAAPGIDNTGRPDAGRRVWRCSTGTLVAVTVFMGVIGLAVPAAAVISLTTGITAFGDRQVPVLAVIGGVALVTLFFGWRLALHPRLVLDDGQVTIVNPFRRRRFDLADVTLFHPGSDGLRVATPADEIEAWCVQKSNAAIKAGRRTRADGICDELWTAWDADHRPDIDPDQPATIRFARPGEEGLLTGLEQAAGLAAFGHIFPVDQFPFPEDAVRQRWRQVLTDRTRQTMIAEVAGTPTGYASYGNGTLHHLGVAPDHQRRGIGTMLLEAAEDEIFADPSTLEASLWVMQDNRRAQDFYRGNGWLPTDETRPAEFPPYPVEIKMTRRNPHVARRGR
jgi:GNAT superfamily N-acetyltransferase